MSVRTLKGTQSASALRTAGTMTLKGTDYSGRNSTLKDVVTVKLPPGNDATTKFSPSWDATVRKTNSPATVWEEEKQPAPQHRKLASLPGAVDRMHSVFKEEARGKARQRALMDELHEDQIKRLGQFGVEIEHSIADLAAHMDQFIDSTRTLVKGTFDGLQGDLRDRIDSLQPPLRELEARGRAVHAGLEEEKLARVRETEEILVPLKERIERLGADLAKEQKIRENRNAEFQQRLTQAVAALDSGIDAEIAARNERGTEMAKEWQHDQEQLQRRQDKLEKGLAAVKDQLFKETELERGHRAGAQDPVVEALTNFIKKFQANAKEQSLLGN